MLGKANEWLLVGRNTNIQNAAAKVLPNDLAFENTSLVDVNIYIFHVS